MASAGVAAASSVEIPKGDPGALRAAGHGWHDAADLLAAQATRLGGQSAAGSTAAIADSWWGTASDAYRSHCATIVGCLTSTSAAFGRAADAAQTFAHDLHHGQNVAKRARDDESDALRELKRARDAHAEAADRLSVANASIDDAKGRASVAQLGGPLSYAQLEQARDDGARAATAASGAACDLHQARAKIETAQSAVERARTQGREANEAADRAARLCASQLGDAAGGVRSPQQLGAAPVPITVPERSPILDNGGPFKLPFHEPTPAEELEKIRFDAALRAQEEHRKSKFDHRVNSIGGEIKGLSFGLTDLGIGDPDSQDYKDAQLGVEVVTSLTGLGAIARGGVKVVAKRKLKSGDKVAPRVTEAELQRASDAADDVIAAARRGSGEKSDPLHRVASFVNREQLAAGRAFTLRGGDGVSRTLLQASGEVDGTPGIFEFIVEEGVVVHQRFIRGGKITGVPNQRP